MSGICESVISAFRIRRKVAVSTDSWANNARGEHARSRSSSCFIAEYRNFFPLGRLVRGVPHQPNTRKEKYQPQDDKDDQTTGMVWTAAAVHK